MTLLVVGVVVAVILVLAVAALFRASYWVAEPNESLASLVSVAGNGLSVVKQLAGTLHAEPAAAPAPALSANGHAAR